MTHLNNFNANAQTTIQLLAYDLGAAATNDLVNEGRIALDAGASSAQILNVLFNNSNVQGAYALLGPNSTPTAFVTQLISNITGPVTSATMAATQAGWVTSLMQVYGNYATRGDFAVAVNAYFNTTVAAPGSDLALVQTGLANRMEASAWYAQQPSGATFSSMNQITGIVSTVTDQVATLTAVENTATVGTTFPLTTGSDLFTGLAGNDTFNAALSTGSLAFNPGDILAGGGGNDTLNVTSTVAAATTVAGTTLTAIETVAVQNLDIANAATNAVTLDATNWTGVTTVQDNSSSASVQVKNLANIVNASASNNVLTVPNGNDQTLTINYQSAVVAGTNDSATITLNNNGIDATTAHSQLFIVENGIENMTLATTGAASFINLTDTALKTLTVTGTQNLDLTNNNNMFATAQNASSATTVQTVNASALTGDLAVDLSGTAGSYVSVVGGSGNDTITMQTLTKNSTISGGTGTADTLVATTGITNTALDAFTHVTGIEKLNIGFNLNSATLDLTGAGSPTDLIFGVTNDNNSVVNAASGFTLETGDTVSNLASVVITNAASGTADVLNISVGSAAVEGNATTRGTITANNVETVTISSLGAGVTQANANTLSLTDTAVKTLTLTGAQQLVLAAGGGTALTSVDGSQTTGGVDISALTLATTGDTLLGGSGADIISGSAGVDSISAGDGNDTITMGANLKNTDTIDGGAGTADILNATINGATATTGAFHIANVETVRLQATASATVDATNITGASIIALQGSNSGNTVTVTHLAAGATVGLGAPTAGGVSTAYTGTASFALTDATGTADSLNIKLGTTAAQTGAIVKTSGIETLNISRQSGVTVDDNTLNLTSSDATTVNVSGAFTGKTIALGTLKSTTTAVDGSGVTAGTLSATLNNTVASTMKAGAGANSLVQSSSGNTTFTVGKGFDVNDTITGGTGTVDVLNATIDTTSANLATMDYRHVTNVETVNLAIDANVLSVIATQVGAASTTGLNDSDVKTVTVSAANTATTFQIGTVALGGSGLKTFDSTGVAGGVDVLFTEASLATSSEAWKAGTGISDIARVSLSTTNTGKVTITGFEQIEAYSAGTTSLDLTNATHATGLNTAILTTDGSAESVTLNGIGVGVAVDIGYGTGDLGTALGANGVETGSTATLNLVDVTGTADALTVNVNKMHTSGALTLVTNGVENLTVNLNDAALGTSLTLTDTATSSTPISLTLTGSHAGLTETLSSLPTGVAVIDASTMASNLTMTATRSAGAMTITGGSGTDTIYMENGNDVINGGSGTGNKLVIVQLGTVGGFQVDLSSTTDQVTQYNGVSNVKAQTGFTSVDLSQVTGSFGADITANSHGSTITGTSNADTITLGAGTDHVNTTSTSGIDSISGFTVGAAGDALDVNFSLVANDSTVVNLAGFSGTHDVVAGNFLALDSVTIASATGYTAATNVIFAVNSAVHVISADTTAAFRTMFGAGGTAPLTVGTNDQGHFLVVAYDGTTASANAAVFEVNYATASGGVKTIESGDTVTLVGILNHVGADTLVAGNFL